MSTDSLEKTRQTSPETQRQPGSKFASAAADRAPRKENKDALQERRSKGSSPSGATSQGEDQAAHPDQSQSWTHLLWILAFAPSWLTSLVLHVIALLVLALITIPEGPGNVVNRLTMNSTGEEVAELKELEQHDIQELEVDALPRLELNNTSLPLEVTDDVMPVPDADSAAMDLDLSPIGDEALPTYDLLGGTGPQGQGLEGRGGATKEEMIRQAGGTAASEAAVLEALKWFVRHQNPDGSWSIDHRFGPCQGRCRHPGSRVNTPNGATALALLPFLGAGHTHKNGEYKETIEKGLAFLLRNMRVIGRRGSLVDDGGNYYSHGLAAIVLCEAYAMTRDQNLMAPAQMAINETVYAQDKVGGGWRYKAHQAGDTSALGWQLMALKSAHMAYLEVPPITIRGASRFLDSVQTDSGSRYGYTGPGNTKGTTSVGLLCRMYLGWKHDEPALVRGVQFLSKSGPSAGNMYYNYYATQTLRHFGGDMWKKWNEEMREYLIETQNKTGHEKGSWFFRGGGHAGNAGGRVYATSMATMILEVYYRHMPIYQSQAADDDFPL